VGVASSSIFVIFPIGIVVFPNKISIKVHAGNR